MPEFIAPCGVDCSQCVIFIATRSDNRELREKIAEYWTQRYQREYDADEVHCDGCLADGRLAVYCHEICDIRPCARERHLTDCSLCPEYECDRIRKFRETSG